MVKLLLQRSTIVFQNFLTSNLIEISLLKPIKAQKYFKCFFTSNSVYDLFEISVFISCNLYWLFEHILSLVNVLTLCIIAILENSKIRNNLHLTLTFSLDQQEVIFKGFLPYQDPLDLAGKQKVTFSNYCDWITSTGIFMIFNTLHF